MDFKLTHCLFEGLGTAIMALTFNWSAQTEDRLGSITGTFFILLLLFGPISGAHFNPATTLSVVIIDSKSTASSGQRQPQGLRLSCFFKYFLA